MLYFDDFLSRVLSGVDSDEALDTLVAFISEPNLRNSIDQMRREDRTVPLTGKDGLRLFLNDAALEEIITLKYGKYYLSKSGPLIFTGF